MNRCTALFLALLTMLFIAGCMEEDKNDNPAFSTQPADTIEGLNYLE